MLLDIFGVVLEDIQKAFDISVFDFLEHFFAFSVKVLSDIKLFFWAWVIFFFYLALLFLNDFCHLILPEAKNIVKISLIDIDIFVLLLSFCFLKEF